MLKFNTRYRDKISVYGEHPKAGWNTQDGKHPNTGWNTQPFYEINKVMCNM